MENFVEFVRPDGTVEYRNPNYEAMLAESNAIVPWPSPDITAEDIVLANLNSLRRVRSTKLAETDWWGVSDRVMTQEQEAYREALRNITDNYTSLEDVVWPIKPV